MRDEIKGEREDGMNFTLVNTSIYLAPGEKKKSHQRRWKMSSKRIAHGLMAANIKAF